MNYPSPVRWIKSINKFLAEGIRYIRQILRGDGASYPLTMIDLRIADVDTEFAPTVRPETPVGDAAAALDGAETSAVVVLEGDSVVGLVAALDVVSMVAGGDRSRTTREIMSGPVSTVSPTETVVDAAERIRERGVRHLRSWTATRIGGSCRRRPSRRTSRGTASTSSERTGRRRSSRRTTRRCPSGTDPYRPLRSRTGGSEYPPPPEGLGLSRRARRTSQ